VQFVLVVLHSKQAVESHGLHTLYPEDESWYVVAGQFGMH
jgi:hypothetical protein